MKHACGLRLLAAAFTLSVSTAAMSAGPVTEAAGFDASANAASQLDAALAQSAVSGKHVLLILGANWCHDSRALAGWLETPRLKQLVSDNYEAVFVDIGAPYAGQGRNLDIPARFGFEMKGTPNVLIVSPAGELLNRTTATRWRNAASRSESEIYDALAQVAN